MIDSSKSHEETLKNTEKFLRKVWRPDCFDKEMIDTLEEEYRLLELD